MVVVVFVFVVDYSKKKKKKKRCLVVVLVLKCAHLSLLFLKHEEEAAQFKEQRAKLRAFVRANSALFCFERKRENAESSRKATKCSRFSQTTTLLFNEEEDRTKKRRMNFFVANIKTLNVMCGDAQRGKESECKLCIT